MANTPTPEAIATARRTPMGSFQGELSALSAADLGGAAIAACIADSGVDPEQIDDVFMGCVLTAGQGQAPARQAAFAGGLPEHIPQLRAGNGTTLIAGGMESMTNAPYLLPKLRAGARMGHAEAKDHMFFDGLEDAYDSGKLMGSFAEDCAEKYQFSRESQDEYALRSLDRASKATDNGTFATEITPLTIKTRGGEVTVSVDEQPGNARPDKIPTLRPAFRDNGTVTAANASSISDGAAALVLMRESDARAQRRDIKALIRGHASHAQAPGWFTTAPVGAINKLLNSVDWTVDDVDLWEINEAFAVVPMAAMAELNISPDKVNVHGGACALGHPIGASGTRILVTLLNALERNNGKRGIASLCIGGLVTSPLRFPNCQNPAPLAVVGSG